MIIIGVEEDMNFPSLHLVVQVFSEITMMPKTALHTII